MCHLSGKNVFFVCSDRQTDRRTGSLVSLSICLSTFNLPANTLCLFSLITIIFCDVLFVVVVVLVVIPPLLQHIVFCLWGDFQTNCMSVVGLFNYFPQSANIKKVLYCFLQKGSCNSIHSGRIAKQKRKINIIDIFKLNFPY